MDPPDATLNRFVEAQAPVYAAVGAELSAGRKTAHEIFGAPDDIKLRSCMTLFSVVAGDEPVFAQVLSRFFNGEPDEKIMACSAHSWARR